MLSACLRGSLHFRCADIFLRPREVPSPLSRASTVRQSRHAAFTVSEPRILPCCASPFFPYCASLRSVRSDASEPTHRCSGGVTPMTRPLRSWRKPFIRFSNPFGLNYRLRDGSLIS